MCVGGNLSFEVQNPFFLSVFITVEFICLNSYAIHSYAIILSLNGSNMAISCWSNPSASIYKVHSKYILALNIEGRNKELNLTGLRGPEIELRSYVTLSKFAFVSFLSLTASSSRISSCI